MLYELSNGADITASHSQQVDQLAGRINIINCQKCIRLFHTKMQKCIHFSTECPQADANMHQPVYFKIKPSIYQSETLNKYSKHVDLPLYLSYKGHPKRLQNDFLKKKYIYIYTRLQIQLPDIILSSCMCSPAHLETGCV